MINFANTFTSVCLCPLIVGKEVVDIVKKFRNETQGPHVFSFTLLVMLGTMNLLALLP